jgi:uncharacterized membrane protein YfcA
MSSINLFADYSSLTILTLAFLAFTAGFIDSVAGGGGLIQIPALLINLPNSALPVLFGTNKIASLSGTSIAAYQYSKRIQYNFKVLLSIAFFSFVASNAGAMSLSLINPNLLKPFVLILLILIAMYTFIKKDLGSIQTKTLPVRKQIMLGSLIGIAVGFYDGFFGPGTGSFLVLGFVVVLGFDFIAASAYSKVINCVTNVSALVVFIRQGNYLLELAILMAIFNSTGSIVGSRIAMKKGNDFVRTIFFIVVAIMIARYSYDVFIKN